MEVTGYFFDLNGWSTRSSQGSRLSSFNLKQFNDFVTDKTLNFFKVLDLSSNFLTTADPDDGQTVEKLYEARKVVTSLRVVNDTAER